MKRSAWVLLLSLAASFVGGAAAEQRRPWTQKEFIVTFWCPPPATDEALARVAAEGYNLTWTPVEGLDVAARHGLKSMLMSDLLRPEVVDDPAKRTQLEQLIEKVKNHPALECYHITDEPGAGAFPALGRLVTFLRERDPSHYAYINLFPTYANETQLGVTASAAQNGRLNFPTHLHDVRPDDKIVLAYREHLKQYLAIVKPDLISYDHYHFFKTGDQKQYFLNLALIREAALDSGKPFLNIIQANTIEPGWRLPNATEIRWLVFTTMAYGGRGISYFTYWGPKAYNGLYQDGQPSPLAPEIALLNKDINGFGPTLMTLNSLGAYHTEPLPYGGEALPAASPVQLQGSGEFVVGLFGTGTTPNAFMIVNRDYKTGARATLRLNLPGRTLEELDRRTGTWVRFASIKPGGTVAVDLAPADGRLFRSRPADRLHSPLAAASQ